MLVPPRDASIVFAHTPGGEIPTPYWWIGARFATPTDPEFLLMPALRVVYVPTGLTAPSAPVAPSAFVAYDVSIVRAVMKEKGRLTRLESLEFADLLGRVPDAQEVATLVERVAVVVQTQKNVERMLAFGKHDEALGAMRSVLGRDFVSAHLREGREGREARQGRQARDHQTKASIASRFVRILRLGDYVDAIVVLAAMAVLWWTKGTVVTAQKIGSCIGQFTYGNRTVNTLLVKAVVALGSMGVQYLSPRVAKVLVHNRTLTCAIALAVSVLHSVAGLGGLGIPGLSDLGSLSALPALEGAVLVAGPAAVETVIGCAGEIGEEGTAMRQASELIASVVFVAVHLSHGSAETTTIAAESIERIVAARFGTCLVPRSIIAALLAARKLTESPLGMFREYLQHTARMGSVSHSFAACLVGTNFGASPMGRFI